MSTITITGRACEFGVNSFTVVFDGTPPAYRQQFEVKNLPQCVAALEQAKAALAGQDVAFSVFFTAGRKPNGFDAWDRAQRSRNFNKRAQPAEVAA